MKKDYKKLLKKEITNSPVQINSEIGKLKTVLLKRPDKEIQNITPNNMEKLLFDEIPYLPIAQKEHDTFAQILKKNGCQVLYLEDLLIETLNKIEKGTRTQFLKKFLQESGFSSGIIYKELFHYLSSMENRVLIHKIISGVRKKELNVVKETNLNEKNEDFYLQPMPNLYFTRDASAFVGSGVTINKMTYKARRRESLFNQLIFKYHPFFAHKNIPLWRGRNHRSHIEGGDEIVLSKEILAIGISQRTRFEAIKDLAKRLFKDKKSTFKKILAIKIPENRAMMHLDTVLTMVNTEQFTVHPKIANKENYNDIFILTPDQKHANDLFIQYRTDLKQCLKTSLKLNEIDMIETGNGDPIDAAREQWSDGTNTLAISPGTVVTYNRNYISNELLRKHGIKVIETPSSELSRGRGGPRCMTCPIFRENI